MSAGRRTGWGATAAAAAIGAGLGLGIASAVPVTHTAVSRVSVTPVDGQITPLSPDERRAEQRASMYAAWVGNHTADGSWTPPSATSVEAETPPHSSDVNITVAAPDPEAARTGADSVASTLIESVERSVGRDNPENALAQFRERAPKLAQAVVALRAATIAHAQAEAGNGPVAATERALEAARDEERELRDAQAGDESLYRRLASATEPRLHLEQTARATIVGDTGSQNLMRGGVLGAVAGAGLGIGARSLSRGRGRPTSLSDEQGAS